jgi:hypothetical protein
MEVYAKRCPNVRQLAVKPQYKYRPYMPFLPQMKGLINTLCRTAAILTEHGSLNAVNCIQSELLAAQ